jgi:hypothetical protein
VRVVVVLLAAGPPSRQTGAEAGLPAVAILPTLFMASEEDAAAIQATVEKEGELSAASNSAAG